uniref:Chaperonin 10 n=1 Tax=Ornithorhynchus anatinus TaxID=9258 RepID=A0A6I8N1W4_ORNAN
MRPRAGPLPLPLPLPRPRPACAGRSRPSPAARAGPRTLNKPRAAARRRPPFYPMPVPGPPGIPEPSGTPPPRRPIPAAARHFRSRGAGGGAATTFFFFFFFPFSSPARAVGPKGWKGPESRSVWGGDVIAPASGTANGGRRGAGPAGRRACALGAGARGGHVVGGGGRGRPRASSRSGLFVSRGGAGGGAAERAGAMSGELQPVSVEVGDKVLLPEYGGTKVVLEDKDYFLFRDGDILGKYLD